MSDSIAIRPVAPEDFDAWLPLWDAYNAFYGRSGETALPREITQITWGRFFDGYEPMHAMVAERNGQLLGLVHFLYHRHTTMTGRSAICRISTRWRPSAAKVSAVR